MDCGIEREDGAFARGMDCFCEEGLAKKDRITHRIEVKSVDEIDAEVKKWLKTAYELDTK